MSDIQAWLDEGKALTAETTEGPWEAYADSDCQPAGCPPIIEHLVYAGAVETPIIDWGNGSTKADAEFIADARTRLPQALAALQAVLDMHRPIWVDGIEYCKHCVDFGGEYPCPTVRAIQNELERQETQS